MKQISQNYKSGAIKIEEVASPSIKSGGVLVQTLYSAISLGTEGMKAREGKLSYLGKAKARPDQVKKVLQSVQQQGVLATYQKVMNKLDSLTPLGYSTAGKVVSVAHDVTEFKVGDLVACAGAGYANHSELNFVPKNLVVKIPDGVDPKEAAFSTVGAIAMQGYRQANLQVDEVTCVIGLGLIGQLLIQILKASGLRVVGFDLDKSKCDLALKNGIDTAMLPNDANLDAEIKRITNGKGIDCTFITAGGSSNGPTELAVQIARDRGQVVVIGKTKLDLDWKEYYEKELEVKFSRSYGPGRYDSNYEEGGIDYPIGYVRWTENRNLESFLNLVSRKALSVNRLINKVYSFEEAETLYEKISEGKDLGIGVLLEYSKENRTQEKSNFLDKERISSDFQKVVMGVIGAGNYASSMLLPHLAKQPNLDLHTVNTTTSLSGQNAKDKFGFKNHSTNLQETLRNPEINTVLIATRHKTHAMFVCDSLKAGKAVFVEKPLAIKLEEVEEIRKTILETGNTNLQVGFNRRFSKAVKSLRNYWSETDVVFTVNYRVHAGQMESGSWYLDDSEGTRFIGEAGHFIDTLYFLIQSRPISVYAQALSPSTSNKDDFDNVSAIISYENGSVANLQYLTQGGNKLPKEYIEIHGNGKSAILDNFQNCKFFDGKRTSKEKFATIDKGQKNELESFVAAVTGKGEFEFSIDGLIDTTLVTLGIHKSLQENRAISLTEFWK